MFLCFLLYCAASYDCRTFKIPNAVTFYGICSGICLYTLSAGLTGFIQSVIGIVLPGILLFIFFLTRTMGAGDVKLASAIGAIMGIQYVLSCLIISFFIGALLSLIRIYKHNNFSYRLHILSEYILSLKSHKKLIQYYDEKRDRFSGTIPFASVIFLSHILLTFHPF